MSKQVKTHFVPDSLVQSTMAPPLHVGHRDDIDVLYSFIVQVDRTQLILHTSRPSFAYTVHL